MRKERAFATERLTPDPTLRGAAEQHEARYPPSDGTTIPVVKAGDAS